MNNFSDDFGDLNTYSQGDGGFSAQGYIENYYQKIYHDVKPSNAIINHSHQNKVIKVDNVQFGQCDTFMPKSRCNQDTTDLDLIKNTLAAPRVVTYRYLSRRNFDKDTHSDLEFSHDFTEYEQVQSKLPKNADTLTQSVPPPYPFYESHRNRRYFGDHERVDGNLSGLRLRQPNPSIQFCDSIQNPTIRDNAHKFLRNVHKDKFGKYARLV